MKLSIVFPAYNEEKRILPVLNNYYNFFKDKMNISFEFIIVPNNCSDKTFEIAEKFSIGKKNVIIENIPYYTGKGGAVMKGFELSEGEYIGFVDSDESTSPREFYKLYKNIGNFEGIIGSRKIKGARIIPERKFSKRLGSSLFSFITRFLFNLKFKDTQCGAKIFKKDVAKYLVLNNKEKGWAFDVDLLYLCKRRGYKIKEFPILWVENSGSHLTNIDGIKSVLKLIKYRIELISIFKSPK